MRFLVQRVTEASVTVATETVAAFQGHGFLVLCGIAPDDTPAQAEKLCAKLLKLRVFEDENGAMNRSLMDVNGAVILVSQFIGKGNCRAVGRDCAVAQPAWRLLCGCCHCNNACAQKE